MRSIAIWILLSVGTAFVSTVSAETTSDQFAYGLQLEVSGGQAFYELELPLEVYQGSVRADLGDVRVFNAAGQVVPHALRKPMNRTHLQDVATTELPFFPIPGSPVLDDDLSIHVERTPDGTVVDVQVDSQEEEQKNGQFDSYLLDASGLKRRIDTLELFWTDDTVDFLSDVIVETSTDLVTWMQLTTASVARLSHQTFHLDQNKIILPRTNSRYLRLLWFNGQPLASIAKVRVLTQQSTLIERPAQQHLELPAVMVDETHYRVDLQGALPVSEVTIVLADKNTLAAMRLLSAMSDQGPMRERWRGLAYNLATNGSILTNPSFSVSSTRHRIWELILDESEVTLGKAPRLEFAWQPDRLVFLAQGEGPYYVAYGSSTVEPTNFHIDALLKLSAPALNKSLEPQLVQPGKVFVLGGKDAKSTQSSLPWKEYSLWGILLLGVLLIGGMSFSLYRKLQGLEPPE